MSPLVLIAASASVFAVNASSWLSGEKPIASGAQRTPQGLRNADALALLQAANVPLTYPQVNPYCFEPAISPHIAAEDVKIRIDISTILASFDQLQQISDRLIIEGAGGWLAPINERESMETDVINTSIPF